MPASSASSRKRSRMTRFRLLLAVAFRRVGLGVDEADAQHRARALQGGVGEGGAVVGVVLLGQAPWVSLAHASCRLRLCDDDEACHYLRRLAENYRSVIGEH